MSSDDVAAGVGRGTQICGRPKRTVGLADERHGEHVEQAVLDDLHERGDGLDDAVECGDERDAETAGEHEVEEVVHVPGEVGSDGGGEVADAEEDGPLWGCVLPPAALKALFDAGEDWFDEGLHARAHGSGDEADGLEGLCGLFWRAVLLLAELFSEDGHDGAEVLLCKVVRVVAGEDGDEVGDGASDERIPVLVEAEDELACALEAVAHEGLGVLEELLYGEQTAVDGLCGAHLEALFGLFVDGLEEVAAHLLFARGDDAEAGAHGLCGALADDDAHIAQGNPDAVEHTRHVWMELLGHLFSHLADDEHGGVSAGLVAIASLEKVERTEHLELDELFAERLTAVVSDFAEGARGGDHDRGIVAGEVGFEVLVEAVETSAVVLALLLDEVLDGDDAAEFLVHMLGVGELEDPAVEVVVECGEGVALELGDDEGDVRLEFLAGRLTRGLVSAPEAGEDAIEGIALMRAEPRHGGRASNARVKMAQEPPLDAGHSPSRDVDTAIRGCTCESEWRAW